MSNVSTGGNITAKKRYGYTTGALGEVKQTITYGYDTVWKDKLTSYNGASISYDDIGNPTSDGTWTYTWENGRQLAGMSKSGTTVSFKYNASGLRTRKIVNGVMTKYTLHGKNVVHMTKGSDDLHFFYDAQNKPAVVVYNGTAYAYAKNLQGDIIAILNSTGTAVVTYTYDAWGKPTSTTGTMKDTLGKLNPFRYRGYVYDEETELYYLRSRYYTPEWSRFTNMDVGIKVSRHTLKNNVYAYCSNSIPTHADAEGTDAYWLTDSGNVGGAGHTSLLLEDDDGVWYYFYWGPENYGIPVWTQAKVILEEVPVSFDSNGMLNLKALNDTLNEGESPLYARRYDKATLFAGDYSKSFDHAELLRSTYEDSLFEYVPAYNVLITNCMQASASVMQASNPIDRDPAKWSLFSFAALDIVPTCVGNIMEVLYPSNTVKDDPMGSGLAY